MPGRKTEATELSLAFGVLDIDPREVSYDDIEPRFDGTLPRQKFKEFVTEFSNPSNHPLYTRMFQVGQHLRQAEPYFQTLPHIQWTGPERMAATSAMAKDIGAGAIPISVKADSDVVSNLSPYNIFQALPSGELPASRTENWYSFIAAEQYQDFYAYARKQSGLDLPERISEYDQNLNRRDRKEFQLILKNQDIDRDPVFIQKYRIMAHAVAQKSADLFNANLADSRSSSSRSATMEQMAKNFFRLNSVEYLLAGVDRRQNFAVRILDITSWRRKWEFANLIASPDLNAGQPQCTITAQVRNKKDQTIFELIFRVEIRWSHGKFCGNPEGKLYKNFAWCELPFFSVVLATL